MREYGFHRFSILVTIFYDSALIRKNTSRGKPFIFLHILGSDIPKDMSKGIRLQKNNYLIIKEIKITV